MNNTQKWLDFADSKKAISSQEEYDDLLEVVAHHDKQYDLGQPEISDTDFDKLYFLVKQTENTHPEFTSKSSTTQSIAGTTTTKLPKIKHTRPMLSLAKANTIDEVKDFTNQFTDDQKALYYTDGFILQHKEDGLTIVIYANDPEVNSGKFTIATRGSGSEGENITDNMIPVLGQDVVDNLLDFLDGKKLVVRGEAIINDDDFEKLNTDGQYMNSRNLVSGSIRTKDASVAKDRRVRLLLYTIENNADFDIFTELEQLKFLSEHFGDISYPLNSDGYEDNSLSSVLDKDQVISVIGNFDDAHRNSLNHVIDGLVIKPNSMLNKDKIGFTAHHPKNQLAYKFKAPDATTVLRDVIWQVGSKGQVTPVGIFDTVNLLGANISKASLANLENIKRRDIMIGDTVVVRRSNDVIPQIVQPIKSLRDGSQVQIVPPKNTKVVGGLLFTTVQSTAQKLEAWKIFASKDGLNIDGLSKQTIAKLAENSLIDLDDLSSIYSLDQTAFVQIEGLGQKTYDTLIDQLEQSKTIGLAHVLYSLSISHLGHNLTKAIESSVDDFNDLLDIYANGQIESWVDDFVQNNEGFGPSTKEILLKDLFVPKTIKTILDLQKAGVSLKSVKNTTKQTLSNKVFVITGKTTKPRRELKTLIEKAGGKVSGSVSAKTDYLVTNETSESTKAKKARELSIAVIDEATLLNLI